MVKLQKPHFVYMNGRIIDWDDAKIHVGSEALIRGISVFEGIKGYWRHDCTEFSLLALQEHFNRLCRSALLQELPFSLNYDQFKNACELLAGKLLTKERDLWLRPTLFALEGHWGENTVSELVITCYQQDKKKPDPVEIGISTWQRPFDTALPARIKSAANYQIGRLARIEGRRQGFEDMILLNQWGRIAEATGSCVLIVRDNCVSTPLPSEGCLESITVNIIDALCSSLDIPFQRRPIDRTELLVADEIALAGTLMELGLVNRLGARSMPQATPIFDRIRDEFWACVRGFHQHHSIRMSPVVLT